MLTKRMVIYRVGTSRPKHGSLTFKTVLKKISFPTKLPNENSFFPPGYCLCVCYSVLSAFIYLALQSHSHLSTRVCPISLFRRHIPAGSWNKMFLSFSLDMPFFSVLRDLGENLAWHSLCVSLLQCFSSLSSSCNLKRLVGVTVM